MFSWISLDRDEGEVVLKACEVFYGSWVTGTLTFRTVLNPSYVKDTLSFEVTVAADAGFDELII